MFNDPFRFDVFRELTSIQRFDQLLSELRAPGEFFYRELGLDELDANILLSVQILTPGILGFCSDQNLKRTGQIEVYVNGLFAISPFMASFLGGDPLTTLAHEMIHAHQIATGDLRTSVEENMIYWKGKAAPEYLPTHLRNESPWEKEAHGGMHILVEAYKQSIR